MYHVFMHSNTHEFPLPMNVGTDYVRHLAGPGEQA